MTAKMYRDCDECDKEITVGAKFIQVRQRVTNFPTGMSWEDNHPKSVDVCQECVPGYVIDLVKCLSDPRDFETTIVTYTHH